MTLITLETIGLASASAGAVFAALGVLRGALARRANPWAMLDRRGAATPVAGAVCLTVALLLWIVSVAALSLHVTGGA